jgi:hypothetical protein
MDISTRFPQFSAPTEVTDQEFAHGVSDPDRFMPKSSDLRGLEHELAEWRELAKHIRLNGLDPHSKVRVRPGIQGKDLMRHIGACINTPVPAHERDLRIAALLAAWVNYIRIPGGPLVSTEAVS